MQSNPRHFWRNANLLKVLIGETISDLGSQVGDLALPLLAALSLGVTPAQMAVLLSADYIPRVVVGLLATGWIDRIRRRPVLISANVIRAAVLAAVAGASASRLLNAELLYAAGMTLAALDVVFTTTFVAYLPSLTEPTALISVNAARATTSAGAGVVGPAAAGALIALLGAPVAVAIDSASFLASVGGLTLVRTREAVPVRRTPEHHILAEIAEGWRGLMTQPVLRAIAATAFSANFFYRIIMSVYVLYLTRGLGLSPAIIGIVFGVGGGLGVLIGSAGASAIAGRLGIGRTMIAAHLLFGIFGLPLAASVAVPRWGAPLVFASEFAQLAANAVYMVNRTSLERVLAPEHLRGRIQACRTVVHAVAGLLGLVVGGIVGEQLGPGVAIATGVIGGLTSFVWLSASPIGGVKDL